MKYNCFAGIAFLLISAIGCEKQSEIQETTDLPTPPAKTAEESAKVAKEEFNKNMEDRLKKLDMEISKLREKGRELKGEAQTEWDKKMAALETKRDTARAKLTEVSHATADAWKDLQKHAQATWDDLEKAFQEASR
jgi:predicted nuclease with TOPRIM domain